MNLIDVEPLAEAIRHLGDCIELGAWRFGMCLALTAFVHGIMRPR